MTVWLIEPHDPLITRDGKPFGPTPGARSTSLTFPFPSTTTGGFRTQIGVIDNQGFTKEKIDMLKAISVRGPLLVELVSDGNGITDWLFPAPADALLLQKEGEKAIHIKQLVPLKMPNGVQTDFDAKNTDHLQFVGPIQTIKDKPAKNPPRYWKWDEFSIWLSNPENSVYKEASALGHDGPAREQRLHVSIDPETGAAIDGALFQTSGLEFTHTEKSELAKAQRLALAVIVDDTKQPQQGFTGFGGERRVVNWQKGVVGEKHEKGVLKCPKALAEQIAKEGACRLILLTPASFKEGYRPQWIEQPNAGVAPKLKAIAIQRPQVVSGWNLEKGKTGPKPTRRLAPAGTVLFLSLKEGTPPTPTAIQNWIEEIWMHCISDEEQDRRDGFGLAMLGTWSGKLADIQKGA